MNTSTTFRELREAGACQTRYRHLAKALGGVKQYGQDTPIPIRTILEANGIEDAHWAVKFCRSLETVGDVFISKAKRLINKYGWRESEPHRTKLLLSILEDK